MFWNLDALHLDAFASQCLARQRVCMPASSRFEEPLWMTGVNVTMILVYVAVVVAKRPYDAWLDNVLEAVSTT